MKRAVVLAIIILLAPTQARAAEVPEDIREVAEELCAEKCICPEIVESIAYSESRFTPDIISASGDYYGLCQVGIKWNRDRMARLGISKEDLLTVRGNLIVTVDILAELFEQYEDVGDVLLAYGGFSDEKKRRYHEKGVLPAYINGVLNRSKMYEQQHNK